MLLHGGARHRASRLELGDVQPLEGSDILSSRCSFVGDELSDSFGGDSDGGAGGLLGSGFVGVGVEESRNAPLSHAMPASACCDSSESVAVLRMTRMPASS